MRAYLNLIQEAGRSLDIKFDEIVKDFIYLVSHRNEQFVMYDVDLGFNHSSAINVALSKSATYATLHFYELPAVVHIFLLNPASPYTSRNVYEKAKELFKLYNKNIVIKPDQGAKGIDVMKIEDIDHLYTSLKLLFEKGVNGVVSPYYESPLEYRTIVFNGEAKLSFAKEKVVGWKHTLTDNSNNVKVRELSSIPEDKVREIQNLSVKAAAAIGLVFCTVDILDTEGGLIILEVNGSVFASEYVKNIPNGKEKVENIYRNAFKYRFGI